MAIPLIMIKAKKGINICFFSELKYRSVSLLIWKDLLLINF